MIFSEYLQYDALGLAELVAQKQVHPAELLQLAIERSQQVNPALNAIIIPMHDYAKKRAQNVLSGPFAGVPFLVKDLFQEYAGYPTSYGCQAFKRTGHIARLNMLVLNVRKELLAYYARHGYHDTHKTESYPLDANLGQPLINLHLVLLSKQI